MHFHLIEDDQTFIGYLKPFLEEKGQVTISTNEKDAYKANMKNKFDCAIVDIMLHGELSGLDLIKDSAASSVKHIIALSNLGANKEIIKKSYESGANDFIAKKNLKQHTEAFINKVANRLDSSTKLRRIFESKFITTDQTLINSVKNICSSYNQFQPIFINGESGVGKTQFAKTVLKKALGIQGNFINLNCAGLNSELLSSEFFGHKKGAFTGATSDKKGKIELANNGILFLDEIGDIPLDVQGSLLKVLDEKEFTPVGSNEKIKVNFLLVTATLKNLENLVKKGLMRKDFYFRIMGKTIQLAPLRERKEDLPKIIDHFLSLTPRSIVLTDDAIQFLCEQQWTGNIRELKKTIDRLSDLDEGIINSETIQNILTRNKTVNKLLSHEIIESIINTGLSDTLSQISDEYFSHVISEVENNRLKTYKDFNVVRSSIARFKKKHPERFLNQ